MEAVFLAIHVIVAVVLIALILLQQGKGADMGASLGAGASQTVFGSQGSGSFLSRVTAYAVAVFFATSLLLTYHQHRLHQKSVVSVTETKAAEVVAPDVPVVEKSSDLKSE